MRDPPPAAPFPYTTLFRSERERAHARPLARVRGHVGSGHGREGDRPLGGGHALDARPEAAAEGPVALDRKSTRLNSSHQIISYAVFRLKKKKHRTRQNDRI